MNKPGRPAALFDVLNPEGLEDFARELCSLGWMLICFPETARFLRGCGMTVHGLAEFVGRPILGDKVMGLSAQLYAALVADDTNEEQESLRKIYMPSIKLVYVDLYSAKGEGPDFYRTLPSAITRDETNRTVILQTAVSGGRFVLCSSEQLHYVLKYLHAWKESGCKKDDKHQEFISSLAWYSETTIAQYCRSAGAHYCDIAKGRDFRVILR